MTNTHQDSAAASPAHDSSIAAIFDRLRGLMAACGSNKHDVAIALISACIEEGVDTGPRIIGTLRRLELNPGHAARMLKEGTGSDPARHRWQRDEEGRYSLHEEEA